MNDYVIAEDFTLPSKGLVYSKAVKPNVKLRSMTTEEEMKRLGYSNLQYKLLSEIIDDCLVESPGISSYDMCIGDYQYLFYKLREVTYGKDYKVEVKCPICGKTIQQTIDLSSLEVTEFSEDMLKHLDIELPKTKKHVKLRLQTPRLLDDVKLRADELKKKSPNIKGEPAFLFTLESMIESVDGVVIDPVKLSQFVRSLPMMDVNYILKSMEKIDFGIVTTTEANCSSCGGTFKYPFPITAEFFGPSID